MGLDLRGMLSQKNRAPIVMPKSPKSFAFHDFGPIEPNIPPITRSRNPVRLLEFLFIGTLFWFRDAVQLTSVFLTSCLSHLLNYFYFFFVRIDPQFAQKWGTDAQLQTWFWRGDGINLDGTPLERPEGHPARIHPRVGADFAPDSSSIDFASGIQAATSEPKDLWTNALEVSDLDLQQCPTTKSSLSFPVPVATETSTKLKRALCAFSDSPNAEQLQQLRGILSCNQCIAENQCVNRSLKRTRPVKSKATTRTVRSPAVKSARLHQRKLFFKWRRVKRQKSQNSIESALALLRPGSDGYPDAGFPEVNFSMAKFSNDDFPDGEFPGAEFPGTNFPESRFPGAGVDFPEIDYFRSSFPENAVTDTKEFVEANVESVNTLSLSDAAPGCTPSAPVLESLLIPAADPSSIILNENENKPSKRDRFKQAFQRRSRPPTAERTDEPTVMPTAEPAAEPAAEPNLF